MRSLLRVLVFLALCSQKSFSSSIHPGVNHENFSLNWDAATEKFLISNQPYPQLSLYDNNHYIFYNNSSQSIYLSDSPNSNYLGTQVFNNGAAVNGEYLVYSPESNESISRNFYYYNPSSDIDNGVISVLPYDQSSLIQASSVNQEANLGCSLFYNDWNQLIVGARGESTYTGKVYVFNNDQDLNFSQSQKINSPVSESLMNFGASLTGSGDLLVVGAPNYSNYQGTAFLFERSSDGNYSYTGIQINDQAPADGNTFGVSMKLTNGFLAISSTQVNQGNGKVSIFELGASNALNFIIDLTANDSQINDNFGHDLDLSGSFLLVGAPDADGSTTENSGAAYLFEKDDNGNWTQTNKFAPASLSANDNFGSSVAIAGNLIFVGATKGEVSAVDTGTIYVFENINGNWTETALIDSPTALSNQFFSTDMIAKGEILIASAPAAGRNGFAYVYERQDQNSSNWKLISALDYNQTSVISGNTIFAPLAWSEGKIIVGSPDDNTTVQAGGAFQAFQNPAWTESFNLPNLEPLFDYPLPSTLQATEDGQTVSVDLNGSHPFESSLKWSVLETNDSYSSFDLDQTTGVFSYTPYTNFFGSHNFKIQLGSSSVSKSHTLQVIVDPVNDSPVWASPSSSELNYSMEGDYYEENFKIEDVDGDPIFLSLKSGSNLPAGLSISPTGGSVLGHKITGVPADGSGGGDSYQDYNFTLVATDSIQVIEQSFFLRNYKRNNPPKFEFNGINSGPITLSFDEDFNESVWGNAIKGIVFSDADGDRLSYSILSNPSGTLSLHDSQVDSERIKYLPREHFNGLDKFSIRISDLNRTIQKSLDLDFHLLIESINDPPKIVSYAPSSIVNEDETFSHVIEVEDPDENDTLVIEVAGLPNWLNYDGNRTISGTPTWADYNEGVSSTIFITARDGNGSEDYQFFNLEVNPRNPPPIITEGNSLSFTIDEDEDPVPWSPVTLNATDPNLTAGNFSWKFGRLPSDGIATISQSGSSCVVYYKPDGNFSGVDSFTVKVSEEIDTNASDIILLDVMVNPVEDTPIFSSFPVYSDAVQGYSWQYEVQTIDGDLNDKLQIEISNIVPSWLSLVNISNGNSILRGTPPSGQTGQFDIILRVTDESENNSIQSFWINVLAKNTDPKINQADQVTIAMDEDGLWDLEGGLVGIDPDIQKLTWTIETDSSHGDVILGNNSGENVSLSYRPDGNFSGTDSFAIQLSDGISSDLVSYTVNIQPIPDAPVFLPPFPQDIVMTDDMNVSETIKIFDGDGLSTLTLELDNKPRWLVVDKKSLQETGLVYLSGSPTYFDSGETAITFRVFDPQGNEVSQVLNVSVSAYNKPPYFSEGNYSVTMTEDMPSSWTAPIINASDEETLTGNLIWSVVEAPFNGNVSINADGSNLNYLPDGNFSGLDAFKIGVLDEGGEMNSLAKLSSVDVFVNIQEVPDPPIFISTPTSDRSDYYRWNDESEYLYRIETLDPDELNATISSVRQLPSWLEFNSDEGTGYGILRGTPSYTDEGNYSFQFQASDGNFTVLGKPFNLIIEVDDYPPIFKSVQNESRVGPIRIFIDEDQANGRVWTPPVNYYAYNPDPEISDHSSLQWSIALKPSSGAELKVSGAGERPEVFDYSPPSNFSGLDSFVLAASEGDRMSELKFEVYVRSIPDPPFFILPKTLNYEIEKGSDFKIDFVAQDDDSSKLNYDLFLPHWETHSWLEIIEENQALGTATIGGVAQSKYNGSSLPFTVVVYDETGRYDSLDLNVTVMGGNNPPVITAGNELTVVFGQDGSPESIRLDEISALDMDGDSLTWSLSGSKLPTSGSVKITGDGQSPSTLSYTPQNRNIKNDTFSIRVSDGKSFDEITINALIFQNAKVPVISGNDSVTVLEGDEFAIDYDIIHQDPAEEFTSSLTSAKNWLFLEQIESRRVRIYGTAPPQSHGIYHFSFLTTGKSGVQAEKKFSVTVNDGRPPTLTLLGLQTVRLNHNEIYNEPGFIAFDQKGEDISANVVVSGDVNNLKTGNNQLVYTVFDSSGNRSQASRVVKIYDSSPLVVSRVTSIESTHAPLLAMSSHADTLIAGEDLSGLKRMVNLREWQDLNKSSQNAFLGSLPRKGNSFEFKTSLEATPLTISSFGRHLENFYLAGTFSNQLSVDDKTQYSNKSHSFFLLKLNNEWKVQWLQTFGTDYVVSGLKFVHDKNDNLFLGGNFFGSIELNGGLLLNSKGEGDAFLLSMSGSGIIHSGKSFGGKGYESLVDLEINNENELLVAMNVKKTNQEKYGLILNVDQNLSISKANSFESDEFNQCNDLEVAEDGFYFCGDFNKSLKLNGSEILSESGETGFLLKFNSDFTLNWSKAVDATVSSNFKSVQIDEFNDPVGLVEFDGIINDANISSREMRDVALFRLNGESGEFVWSKQVGGAGDDENSSFILNEQGAISLMLQSSSESIIADDFELKPTRGEFYLYEFNSTSGTPVFEETSTIKLIGNEFLSTKIRVINSPFCRFVLVDSPDWFGLVQHGNGEASITAFPPLLNTTGKLKVRAYDLDGGFFDKEIDYEVRSTQGMFADNSIPSINQTFGIKGNGRILKIMTRSDSGFIVAGNFVNRIDYNNDIITASGRKAGFLLFLDQEMKLENKKLIFSNKEVVLTDCHLDSSDNLTIFGTYEGFIQIESDPIAYSVGGTDLFLTEISASGEMKRFRSLGGSENDFSGSLLVDRDSIILSGVFWGKMIFNDTSMVSKSMQDGYLIRISRDDFQSAELLKTIGGIGIDSINGQSIDSVGEVLIMGNFQNSIEWNGQTIKSPSDSSTYLGKIDKNGTESNFLTINGSNFNQGKFILYDQESDKIFIGGEFEGDIIQNQLKVSSAGGIDLFVAEFNQKFQCTGLISFGGTGKDRITGLTFDEIGNLLIGGTFVNELTINSKTYTSLGEEDSFLSKISLDSLAVRDTVVFSSKFSDRIDSINPIRSNFILLGTSTKSLTRDSQMEIRHLGEFKNNPTLQGTFPSYLESSKYFSLNFSTGPWKKKYNEFSVQEKHPSWMNLKVNDDGTGELSGVSPVHEQDTKYSFSTTIVSPEGEKVTFDHNFTIREINQSSPVILAENQYSALQYEKFNFSIPIFDLDQDSLVVYPLVPQWLNWSFSQSGILSLFGLAGAENVGSHEISVLAMDSSGLSDERTLKLVIKPNLGISHISSIDMPGGWTSEWIGTYAVTDNGWVYHIQWGWVFLIPDYSKNSLWFWKKGWEWIWTEREQWDGQIGQGFLYSSSLQGWVYATTISGNLNAYNYSTQKWTDF